MTLVDSACETPHSVRGGYEIVAARREPIFIVYRGAAMKQSQRMFARMFVLVAIASVACSTDSGVAVEPVSVFSLSSAETQRFRAINSMMYVGDVHNEFLRPTVARLRGANFSGATDAAFCQVALRELDLSAVGIARRLKLDPDRVRHFVKVSLEGRAAKNFAHPTLRRMDVYRVKCAGPQEDVNQDGEATVSLDELPCAEACPEGPTYNPVTGPSSQALALVDVAEAHLAASSGRSDLAARLSGVVSSASSLESHNRDYVQGFAAVMQSSYENAEDEMEGGPCTQEQKRNRAKNAAIVDAGSFAGAMGTAWAVAIAGGPVTWAPVVAGSAVGAVFASGTYLAVALSECGT